MRSCPHCRQILADSAVHCPDDGHALSAPDPCVGELLSGQYQILERIGEGGSGVVYRGWQRGVDRLVAIKILSAGAASSCEFVARFLREAQAAARLSHPNIITVYHIGRTPSALPFIAMEWIPGGPLGRAGQRGLRGQSDEIIDIAKQIASALAEAHGAGIIHRDLKPDNLLLSYRHGQPQVTVVDFGIAKILDSDLLKPGETHLTQLGAVYGTPQYLSPEQACGKCVDARSDIYSLGVVLYQLASGRLPFQSKGVALLVDHLNVDPPALSSMAPETPVRLASLIMRMLAKDPQRRPQSAIELGEELNALRHPGRAISMAMTDASATLGAGTQEHRVPPRFVSVSRPARVPLAAALLSLSLLLSGSAELGLRVAEAESVMTPASSGVIAEAFVLRGPQRALMVASDGYALRVLMPDALHASSQEPMAIEVWDRAGRPVSLPSLVVLFVDEGGQSQGVTVPAGGTLGRYELSRRFEFPGRYSMQVLTEDAEVALQVHFDVGDAASPPNS